MILWWHRTCWRGFSPNPNFDRLSTHAPVFHDNQGDRYNMVGFITIFHLRFHGEENILYPAKWSCWQGILIALCPSSIHLSNCPTCRVRSVAHGLFHGLYSYVAQIQPMRRWYTVYHFQVIRSKNKVTWVIRIFVVRAKGILVDHQSTISS